MTPESVCTKICIGCICLVFATMCYQMPEMMHNHTSLLLICISLVFLHRMFSNVCPQTGGIPEGKITLIAFISLSPLCVIKCVLKTASSEDT